jgi:hypothetical protein
MAELDYDRLLRERGRRCDGKENPDACGSDVHEVSWMGYGFLAPHETTA